MIRRLRARIRALLARIERDLFAEPQAAPDEGGRDDDGGVS